MEQYRARRCYKGGTWAFVSVNPSNLRPSAKRINVTMPQRVLDALDLEGKQCGETRSGYLTQAALERINKRNTSRKGRQAG